jgi:peptidoglycan/xylan/chitin deacetylase (PgdA/CDA1 family)
VKDALPENAVFELHPLRLGGEPEGLARGEAISRISGPDRLLAEHNRDLPFGPAGLEALAARLRRLGARVLPGEPVVAFDRAELVAAYRDWGSGSVQVIRSDPSLLPELAVGGWFDAGARARAVRRLTRFRTGGAEAAFWRGVHAESTADEWLRLTRGYSVVLYHRLAGELRPGQERIDVPPRKFEAQMRLLRRLRFTALSVEDLVGGRIARRSVVVTVDDAVRDVVEPLRRHAALHPQLFVPTGDVGRPVEWLGGELVASWAELAELAAVGVELGAHTRSHVDLPASDDETAEREIRGSRGDLEANVGSAPVAFAYPHGRFGGRERELVRSAGFSLAFTTRPGRNGAGTDPFALRRVSVKAWDSRLSFAWKLVTGEQPPKAWERWLLIRAAVARRLARGRPSARARGRAPSTPTAAPPPRREP